MDVDTGLVASFEILPFSGFSYVLLDADSRAIFEGKFMADKLNYLLADCDNC